MLKSFEVEFGEWEKVQLRTEPGIMYLISGYLSRPGSVSYFIKRGTDEFCVQGGELEKFVEKRAGFSKG